MREKTIHLLMAVILVVLVLSLPACGTGEPELSTEERVQTLIAETMAVENIVQTVVAATLAVSSPPEMVQEEPEVIDVPEPTATEVLATQILATTTESFTPTPSVPIVSVSMDTNCRQGPGQIYDSIGALLVGEQAEVIGVSGDVVYWIIKNPDQAGECWLWANYATVSGETAGLPRFTPPPTPTPIFTATSTLTPTPEINWTGTWTTSLGMTGFPHQNLVVTMTQTNNTVTGSFTVGTNVFSLNGTLSADYMTLTGTYSHPLPDSGPFVLKLISPNQFNGNMDSGFHEWCGSRAGTSLPSPCMGP